MALEVEGGILWLCKLREGSCGCVSWGRDLVAVEDERGILWLCKLREGSCDCGS